MKTCHKELVFRGEVLKKGDYQTPFSPAFWYENF